MLTRSLALAALVLAAGVASPLSPAALAATVTNNVTISADALTSGWLPVSVVVKALNAEGWTTTWSQLIDALKITAPPEESFEAAGHVPTRPGDAQILLNGKIIGMLPQAHLLNPLTGHVQSYFPLYSLEKAFRHVGLTATLGGSVFSLTSAEKTNQVAPPMKPNSILRRTLVANAGVTTVITDEISASEFSRKTLGSLAIRVNGAPCPVRKETLLSPSSTDAPGTDVLRFSFAVSRNVPAGTYPVSFVWSQGKRSQAYTAKLDVPALFIAMQEGIMEVNLLGQRVYPSGSFVDATQPMGIVYDPRTQRVYVSDANAGAVLEYNTSGVLLGKLDPLGLTDPTYLALNASSQELYVYNAGGTSEGIVRLTLSGDIEPWTHRDQFSAVFAQGQAMAYDPIAKELFVARSLGSQQAAAHQSAVIAYNATTGSRVIPSNGFLGTSPSPTSIVFVPSVNTLFVGGIKDDDSNRQYLGGYSADGTAISSAGAFAIGATNTGHVDAMAYDPLNGELVVLGDANLHFFTTKGTPVPALTSRSSSATPVTESALGGDVGMAIAY